MDRIAGYFPASSPAARAKFLAAVQQGGARLLSSHTNTAQGPHDEDCVTDVAWIGPQDAAKLLILVSGTHGAEGYAGSGCHVAWLQERWFERVQPKDTAVLLIHAMNPHGFAWGRRVNEDNIDLNRNLIDHSRPRPENPDYAALAAHIDPPDWAEPGLSAHNRAIAQFLGGDNHDVMSKAVHGGQYMNPRGVFFGGTRPAWSNTLFRQLVAEHAAKAEHVAIIDYHTGGGVWGYCDLFIDDDHAGSQTRNWFSQVSVISEDKAAHGKNAQSETPGNLFYSLPEILPGRRVTLCLVELRTGESGGHDIVRAENWLFQHGDPKSALGLELRARMLERFYPARREWRVMVAYQSNAMLVEALCGLSAL
ncbi:MAG: M14 family metallopeptidase [Rhodoferax sp.]|nr:M14 family metallopeptidase [Rhodoferax sp.]